MCSDVKAKEEKKKEEKRKKGCEGGGGANAGTVVLLHPPLSKALEGFSIVQERGCQHFDSTEISYWGEQS